MNTSQKVPAIVLMTVAYAKALQECYQENPDDYMWPIEKLDTIVQKTMQQVLKGRNGYSISSSMILACKYLGIRPKYQAINAYLTVDHDLSEMPENGQALMQKIEEAMKTCA